MRNTALLIPIALNCALFAGSASAEQQTCVTVEQMKKITIEAGMSPVFQGISQDGMTYIMFGQPQTGEWVELRISDKPAAACIMTYGAGFAVVAPKEAPKK